jgi:hypothetical protein
MIPDRVNPLTFFLGLGCGEVPQAGTERNTPLSLISLIPRWQADDKGSEGKNFQKWLFRP